MPVTSLLSIPDELLTRIAEYSGSRSKWQLCALARTCRRLSRIAQAQLFNDIEVDSADELCALAVALQRRQDLRAKIVHLRIDFVETIEVELEPTFDIMSDDDISYALSRNRNIPLYECGLTSLLGSGPFSALIDLELHEFPPSLLSGFLRQAGTAKQLQQLQKIELVGFDVPFATTSSSSAELWSLLSVFPSLNNIEMQSPGLRLPTALTTTGQLRNVRTLRVGDIDALDPAAIPLTDFLAGLEHLVMHGPMGRRALPTCDFDNRSFAPLEDLSLTGAWDLLPALPLLQKIRLRNLALDDHAMEVSDELLLGLVSKLEHLRLLKLDHMKAPLSGEALEEHIRDSLDWDDHRAREVHEEVRDSGPRWTNTATSDGYAAALDIAKQRGIRVTGSAVACVAWVEGFERHFEKCLIDYAVKSEGLAFLVDHYGAEHALRRDRPALRQLFFGA